MSDRKSAVKPHDNRSAPEAKEPSLKGTFASVMLLGAFLAITWIGVFILFVARN